MMLILMRNLTSFYLIEMGVVPYVISTGRSESLKYFYILPSLTYTVHQWHFIPEFALRTITFD